MKKIAIFVEGLTEQEFVIALVLFIVHGRGVSVIKGRQFKNVVTVTSRITPLGVVDFQVLVVDCAGDGQVKTQIKDQYPTLVKEGYSAIIGLRDIYPMSSADVPKITKMLHKGLPSYPVKPRVHLAVMETEAWFIDETSHFSRLDAGLSLATIAGGFPGFANTPSDAWSHPARLLHDIYKLAGLAYLDKHGAKTKNRIRRTVKNLSFNELLGNCRARVRHLDDFVSTVEAALF